MSHDAKCLHLLEQRLVDCNIYFVAMNYETAETYDRRRIILYQPTIQSIKQTNRPFYVVFKTELLSEQLIYF